MGLAARDVKTLKGQCHEIFNPFFGIKQLYNGQFRDYDYVHTTMITRTQAVDFEGFSLTLKEQSVKIKYLCVFSYPIAIIKKC